ncbi:MAG: methionine--tRNA ligase, partial [Actinomycetes bacterium]
MKNSWYLTTSIPYVNGSPHLGHALEFVHADALARHARTRGRAVRLQSGTDDHAIKNVAAAEAAGRRVSDVVAENGARFVETASALGVQFDEFVRTSSDLRHAPAVESLWAACAASGDLYQRPYSGAYCTGCEQFYDPDELVDGLCSEHGTAPQPVTETNWFFRLSRYKEELTRLLESGEVRVEPPERLNEVLGFLRGPVHDISVSRPEERANGWGIAVPGDPTQVVYVWFDALTNYLTGLGYGSDHAQYAQWWAGSTERVHIVGKGIARFHAVFWLAFLLSADLPLPSRIDVHDYLTVNGEKIAKSGAQAADPGDLVERFGADAVRWWLLREPAPVGTTDFTEARLVDAYNRDLANGLGNLTSRCLTLTARKPTLDTSTTGVVGASDDCLVARAQALPQLVDDALDRYDFRAATRAICSLAEEGNRF